MKILFLSTAPWGPSSYSVLTARTVPEIVRQGHEVHISTWYGLQGAPQRWPIRARGAEKTEPPLSTVVVYPSFDGNSFGVDTLLATYKVMNADCLITCMDAWVLPPAITGRVKFAAWLPVDHDPAPANVVQALSTCIYPIAFSRWGRQVLKQAGVEAHYIPCSADSNVFQPMDKAEARKSVGVPDDCDYLAAMVAANKDPSDRKGFAEALIAFAQFCRTHPKAMMYIHTNWEGPINITALADRLGLAGRLIRPEPLSIIYGLLNDQFLKAVYCASDLLLNPSKSEGFCLPIVEAQMCGTSVAATDFSTTDELVFGGFKIEGQPHWSLGADSFRKLVYIDSVREALEWGWENRGNEVLAKRAREGACEYDTAHVAETYWRPALKDIEDMVSAKGGEMKLVQL